MATDPPDVSVAIDEGGRSGTRIIKVQLLAENDAEPVERTIGLTAIASAGEVPLKLVLECGKRGD